MNNNAIPQVITQDWFNNNSKYYTLNRSSLFESNTIFSSFVYSDEVAKSILSSELNLGLGLSSFFKSLDLSSVAVKIIDDTNTAYTDGQQIFIGYQLKNENGEFQNANDKLDIFLGLFIHEVAHIYYSNFNKFKFTDKIRSYIQNLIEDEMIERKLVSSYPGYGNFLGKLKYFMFDNVNCFDEVNHHLKNEGSLDEILSILFFVIRYPKYISMLNEDVKTKYNELFWQIQNVMRDKGAFNIEKAKNISEITYSVTTSIFNLIVQFLGIETVKNETPKTFYGENSTTSKIDKINTNTLNNRKLSNKADNLEYKENEATKMLMKAIDIPSTNVHYNNVKNSVESYISMVKKILVKKEEKTGFGFSQYRKSGILDSSRLVPAIMGNPNVYKRMNWSSVQKDIHKLNVVILVDNSGSMIQVGPLASKIGVLFYEGLKHIKNVTTYVYGHSEYMVSYLNKKHNYMTDHFCERYIGGGQSERLVYTKLIDMFKSDANDTLIINITDSKYLSDYNEMKALIDCAKAYHIYFGLITLNDEEHNEGWTKMNHAIYGDNYTEYDGDFSEMIESISKNIKKLLG